MRRILCKIPSRPTTIVCTAADGGRATIAATFPTAGGRGFLPTDHNLEKPKKPHAFIKVEEEEEEEAKFAHIFGVSAVQSAWARKQLKNEERARKAFGILFRDYGGRATRDDEEEKVAKTKNRRKITEDELDAFLSNFVIECGTDYEKYKLVGKTFYQVIEKMTKDDDELGVATQNDRVDKLAEMAEEEEVDAFLTNSFTTNLMIECDPKYEQRFRQVIWKVRKKSIQDDAILKALELVTKLMSKCEPQYEKFLRQVLEKVRDKITQQNQEHLAHDRPLSAGFRRRPPSSPSPIFYPPPLSPLLLQPRRRRRRLSMWIDSPRLSPLLLQPRQQLPSTWIHSPAEAALPSPLTSDFEEFLTNLMIECEPIYEKRFRWVIEIVREKILEDYGGTEKASLFLTCLMSNCEPGFGKLLGEVLEKLRREKIITQDEVVGNENVRKLANLNWKVGDVSFFEEKLDEFVTNTFLRSSRMVEKMKPCFMAYEAIEKVATKLGNENVRKIAEEKLDALVTNSFLSTIVEVEMMKPFFMFLSL